MGRGPRGEEAFAGNPEWLRTLVEHVQDIICVLDASGQLHFVTPSITPILGYEETELIGRNVLDLVHPDDLPRIVERLAAGFGDPGTIQSEMFRFRHKDGSWRVLDGVGRAYQRDEETTLAVVTLRDATERNQLEEQLRQSQKLEAVGQLAGGLAHDFNNILTVVGLSAAMIRDTAEGNMRSLAGEIAEAADRGASLTRRLLTFARKQQPNRPEILDLNRVINDLHKLLRRLMGDQIGLVLDLSAPLDRIKADAGHLEQVMINLALNARDAMTESGTLRIETGTDVSDRRRTWMRFRDNGRGMSSETVARIFEPFFTTKPPGKGTGLGLSMVYGIVEQCNGHIKVDSEPGKGTAITVYFPSTKESETPRAGADKQGPLRGTGTVLVVEDERSVRHIVKNVLEGSGFNVLEAWDGNEAMRVMDVYDGPIHLLLTDIMMPGKRGWEISGEYQKSHPDGVVLYMTGYSDEDLKSKQGIDPADVLLKPFSTEDLGHRVREALKARKPD